MAEEITWLRTLIVFIVPLAQLYARINWLDGSLDKMWTLLPFFWIPPFTAVPAIMMKYGYIAPGKGGKPYDSWMLIPIIAKFFIALVVPMLADFIFDDVSDTFILFASLILQLLINTIPNIMKSYEQCNGLDMASLTKAFMDGTIANGVADIVPFILGFLPIVGILLEVLEMLLGDFASSLIWALGYSTGYIFINMFNADKGQSFCDVPFGGSSTDKSAFWILLILTIVLKLFNEYSPL